MRYGVAMSEDTKDQPGIAPEMMEAFLLKLIDPSQYGSECSIAVQQKVRQLLGKPIGSDPDRKKRFAIVEQKIVEFPSSEVTGVGN